MADIKGLPGPHLDAWEWQVDAACRGMCSSLFFHPWEERGPARERREAAAKAICRQCPVVIECRIHALAIPERYGIWGALSEAERGGTRVRVTQRTAAPAAADLEPTG